MSPIIKWLLAKSQMQKSAVTGWGAPLPPQGAYPNVRGGAKPAAPAAPAGGGAMGALNSVLSRGGGNGWKAPGSPGAPALPTPAVSSPTAKAPQLSLAEAGNQVNQAMRSNIRNGFSGPRATPAQQIQMAPQTRIADDPTYRAPKPATASKPQTPINATPAAMQGQQEMNPSDRAKAIFAQVNQRRRDAAFGRGAFSAAEEKALMDQGNSLLNQSNTMRNAPGYKPDVKSMHPRDQADRLRIQLNQQRSAAGGEVPQAGQVMRQLNRFNAAADAMPAPKMPAGGLRIPGAPSPRPAGPTPMQRAPMQEPMIAKTSAAYEFGALLGAQ